MTVIVPKRQVLEWWPFPERKPPKGTCLFTDGVATWWIGWYSESHGDWLAASHGRHHSQVLPSEVKAWAYLGNWIQQTDEE